MKLVFFIHIILLLIFSCSTDDIEDDSDKSSDNSVLVKKVVHSSNSTLNYAYNGNKLDKIISDVGFYIKFTYEGDLITKIETFNSSNTSTGDYQIYIYANNKLIQIQYYNINILNLTENYNYNSDGSISKILSDAEGNTTNKVRYRYYYDDFGHYIKIEDIFQNKITATHYYNYDNANSPYKNIIGYGCYENNINNIIKERTITSTSRIYENHRSFIYNSQGYPISCTITESDGKKVTIHYYY